MENFIIIIIIIASCGFFTLGFMSISKSLEFGGKAEEKSESIAGLSIFFLIVLIVSVIIWLLN